MQKDLQDILKNGGLSFLVSPTQFVKQWASSHKSASALIAATLGFLVILVPFVAVVSNFSNNQLSYQNAGAAYFDLITIPNPIPVCDDSGRAGTTLSWTATDWTKFTINRGTANGTILYTGSGPGSMKVENVANGETFYLVTQSISQPRRSWSSRTIKTVMASVSVSHTFGQGCAVTPPSAVNPPLPYPSL